MKYINSLKKIVIIISITTQAIFSVALAGVSSVSYSPSIKIDGQQYDSASVKCSTIVSGRTLLKRKGTSEWCDSTVVSACYSDKIKAAQFVCSKSYRRQLKKFDVSNSSEIDKKSKDELTISVDELNAEKIKIEGALLEIRAKRSALRQRELILVRQIDGV